MTTILECEVPFSSVLDRDVVKAAYFRDSYRTTIRNKEAGVVDIFFAIFGHKPYWMRIVLLIRNRIAALCGLSVPTAAQIMNPKVQASYRIGDTIGPWPIFALTESELVAGRNNKHLDFRLSVLKEPSGEGASAVVSTVCTVHNRFGKVYLFFIVPFHKWGVQRLMANAIAAGRL